MLADKAAAGADQALFGVFQSAGGFFQPRRHAVGGAADALHQLMRPGRRARYRRMQGFGNSINCLMGAVAALLARRSRRGGAWGSVNSAGFHDFPFQESAASAIFTGIVDRRG